VVIAGPIMAPGGHAGAQVVHTGAGGTQTGSFFRQQQQPTSPRAKARIARLAGILVSFMEHSKFGGPRVAAVLQGGGRGRPGKEGCGADVRYSLFNSTRLLESGLAGR